MKSANGKLTIKEQRFVEEFPVDWNATAAAERAGYKARSNGMLRVIACKLLTKDNVERALLDRMRELGAGSAEDARNTLTTIRRILLSDARRLFCEDGRMKEVRDLDDDTAAAISSIEVTTVGEKVATTKVRFWSKTEAANQMCKILALYKELGSKDNPLTVQHIDLNTVPLDDLARIRDNPALAASLLARN